jgi:signal transduction histidine kinase/HAMP domain-containing protein
MRRLRLSTLLVILNAGLLLLAVAGVALVAARLLRQLADEQALARVEQAGLSARSALDHAGRDAAAAAQLLAERPTLLRLAQAGEAASLTDFLTQFQATSQLDGAAVLAGGLVFAASGLPLPWAGLAAPAADDYIFYAADPSRPLALVAAADVPAEAGLRVVVAMGLDEAFAQQVSDEIGLPVTLWPAGASPLGGLRAAALADGQPHTAHLGPPGEYVAVVPFSAPAGVTAGLVETRLAGTAIESSVRRLIQGLLGLALVVALLAAALNFILGQRLGRPLQGLARAAARIGYGDLATPVPTAPGGEIGTLAATLEEMRGRLQALTLNLRRQQSESNAILTGINDGVFAVDRERRIQYVNPRMAALLGQPAEAMLGRFCGDVLRPMGADGTRPCEENCPILHARFQAGARAAEHLRLFNGEQRLVIITSAAPGEEPAPAGALRQVQVMRDETDVEAARRLRDAILANISHEFKTPLSAQLASIELLLDQLPELSPDQVGGLVVSLQQGALRLTQLIDNLLESVRIEAGQDSIRRRPVALDEVIEQALELTRPLLELRRQAVLVDLPYPCPPVCGDAPRLSQVFVNLLANANKFAPPDSAIHIGGAVAAETVTLWVEDQGPGLPALAAQPLFARFTRATGEEPEQGGVGLGLWIVKSIVERHGGGVEARSLATGTRMVVVLPRMSTDEDPGR